MSETPISPLRQRMIEDMNVRKLGAATQRNYIRAVKILSDFLGRSPATATAEDLRRFQVHQSEAGAQPSVMNNTVTALRFFLRVTLDRPEMGRHLTLVRQPRKLPNVLSEEEVVRLLEHASGLKYRAALGVAYGAGLRVSEVANLKVSDIDSKRMLIRIEEGILRSLPGVGRIVLATLLAEAWEPLRRRDYHALRNLCGVAPVTRRSGKTHIVLRRRACHPRLANAVYHWARVAVQNDRTSRAKYEALRDRGHGYARVLVRSPTASSTSRAPCSETAPYSTHRCTCKNPLAKG